MKSRMVNNMIWSGVESYGIYGIKFIFSISIARILDPKDYGLVGMMAIFIDIGKKVSESGFQTSLLQKKEPTITDYSSVFFLKNIVSIILYLVLYFSANLIAEFYNEPQIVLIAKVTSLGLIISSLGSIHQAWFVKNLQFKNIAKISLMSSTISGGVGITMALYGFGVWSLIFQTLVGQLINTIFSWIFTKLKLKFQMSLAALKKMYSYGSKIFIQVLLDTIFSGIYYPIIGKYFSVNELGYFANARRLQQLTISQTTGALGKVLFPTFSSFQDDDEKLNQKSKQSFRLLLFILYPFVVILLITAYPFVNFFLTSKWIPAVTYIELMYLFGFITPFFSQNKLILNAIGKSYITLKINIIGKLLTIIAIVVGFRFGVIGLIVANLIVACLQYFLSAYFIGFHTNYRLKNQLTDIFPVLLISLFTYFLCLFSASLVNINDLLSIISRAFIVLACYYFLMKLFKPKTYKTFRAFVINYIPKKFQFLI